MRNTILKVILMVGVLIVYLFGIVGGLNSKVGYWTLPIAVLYFYIGWVMAEIVFQLIIKEQDK